MNKSKILKTLLFCFVLSVGALSTQAQRIYVKVRPAAPVVVRTAAPRADYIWVEGEWVASGRTYVWKPGYWVEPRKGYRWIPGHWVDRRGRGSYWIAGHWVRI